MDHRASILTSLLMVLLLFGSTFTLREVTSQFGGSTPIVPSTYPLFVGSSGSVKIDIPKSGIAVRIEIPREFLQGVVSAENDTHFIQSNIRNDYYYYNLVDESSHWTYPWRGLPSDGPCFKPMFSNHDPNAPWCLEIWNFLNGQLLNFTAPKFVIFNNLNAPPIAGLYNFTLFVADRTNSLGYPDFFRAWNTTLFVPVSMSYNPGSIRGWICDGNVTGCPNIPSKGVVYAKNVGTGQMARAYVNQSLCSTSIVTCGMFQLTGLAPGSYIIQASAGVSNGIAYSLSTQRNQASVSFGSSTVIGNVPLRRAPQVCGATTYENSLSPGAGIRSFSGHPYLPAIGFIPNLNVTIEGRDPWGHIYRFQNISFNTSSDRFALMTGSGVKYAGTDPYGTEFAGLVAPEDQGAYTLILRVWITGYLQQYFETARVTQSPGTTSNVCTSSPSPNPIVMRTGSVISATLQLQNLLTLETPHQAEASLPVPSVTDALFGGNVLIQTYNSSGVLAGVSVYAGTSPDGKTIYANSNSLRVYIIGFTEYFNHSWSGFWQEKDYGLSSDGVGFTVRVFIRGYEQATPIPIPMLQGMNQSITIRMIRGGAFSVFVGSYDNRFGTRTIQAQLPWRFLDLAIPVPARVYFYGSGGVLIGFVQALMITSLVNSNNFQIIFAGQNWSLREIWFYGDIPTHITNANYNIRAYTLGYVPLFPNGITSTNDLVGFGQVNIALLYGNELDITVPIFAGPQTFATTPEYDHAIGQAYSGGLAGAVMANVSSGTPTLQFPIFGFGGMVLNNLKLVGQGHFFYVAPDGSRYFDNGLDVGNYTAQLPEFGFTVHFLQVLSLPVVAFRDLFLQTGTFLKVYAMARIVDGALLSGWVVNPPLTFAPLSWAQVQAANRTYSRSAPTFDGQFNGVGALQLPAGIYNITFSDLFYQNKIKRNFQVQWNAVYNLSPEPLCPVGGISGTCSPSEPVYFSLTSINLIMTDNRKVFSACVILQHV